jgi:RNA polymerase sigma-70 factor (ECF subfamily)
VALKAQEPRPDRGFERIYRRHVGDVYHYALAVMRNQPDAEDVTQTTFLNAYRAFQRGERPEKAHNWLITIAHNVCRQRFRQSARRPHEVEFDEDIGDRLIGAPEEEIGPTAEDIRRALGHLAFNQRAALVMRELEGRSYAEIGEILSLSPSAVETLIFRARRALREQLETSLTCGEAELAISRQLDGMLPRKDKGALRAHLRECPECATFARRQRAQRSALRSLAAVPVPASLTSLFGGGGATVGTAVALKAGAAVTAALVVGGVSYIGARHALSHPRRTPVTSQSRVRPPARRAVADARPSTAQRQTAPPAVPASARAQPSPRRVHGYHGDASISARHAGLPHRAAVPRAPQPGQAAQPARRPLIPPGQAGKAVPKPHPKAPPGPYIGGPPPGHGNGGHGKH